MYEVFEMTDLELAQSLSHKVLMQVSWWLRPFCKVKWISVSKEPAAAFNTSMLNVQKMVKKIQSK